VCLVSQDCCCAVGGVREVRRLRVLCVRAARRWNFDRDVVAAGTKEGESTHHGQQRVHRDSPLSGAKTADSGELPQIRDISQFSTGNQQAFDVVGEQDRDGFGPR
jgi:hypothetical protein